MLIAQWTTLTIVGTQDLKVSYAPAPEPVESIEELDALIIGILANSSDSQVAYIAMAIMSGTKEHPALVRPKPYEKYKKEHARLEGRLSRLLVQAKLEGLKEYAQICGFMRAEPTTIGLHQYIAELEKRAAKSQLEGAAGVAIDKLSVPSGAHNERETLSMKTATKHLFVTKSGLLGTFAKYAVSQSPYPRPDNLEVVLDKLSELLRSSFKVAQLNVGEFEDARALESYLSETLAQIPEYVAWNDRKNGNDAPMKFTSRYDTDNNPDDDFIDLDALQRNVATEIEREQA